MCVETLPFARDGGEECRPCVNLLRIKQRLGESKEEIMKKLADPQTADGERQTFLADRLKYIVLYNQSPSGRVCHSSMGFVKVSAKDTSGIHFEEFLGWLWPLSILKKHNKRPPKGSPLVQIRHKGMIVKGYILDSDVKKKIGCIKITQETKVEVVKETTAADSTMAEFSGGVASLDKYHADLVTSSAIKTSLGPKASADELQTHVLRPAAAKVAPALENQESIPTATRLT